MDYRSIAEAEAKRYGVFWCTGQCGSYRGHKRGFACKHEPIVHLASTISTRSTLHRFMHELGHTQDKDYSKRQYEREAYAESFASAKLREYGIPLPRKQIALGKRYIARKKRHGDRIIASK